MPPGLLAVLIAPFVGSFLGVLIRRLPAGAPVALSRSACEHCGMALGARDLVPIGSYLALHGRCRSCGARIAPFHLGVELAALGIALWAWSAGGDAFRIWAGCLLGWTLLALAWIDWEHMLLPDALTLPLVVLGLAATWLAAPAALADRAAAALLGWSAFVALGWLYRRLRGRDGLGQGDAKLLAAGGAWLGLLALPWVVLAAALIGLAAAVVLHRGRVHSAAAVPFGPWLAVSIWLVWLYGAAWLWA
jgi:leader peptidase (prepilin peptidase)/N-methyltransferase